MSAYLYQQNVVPIPHPNSNCREISGPFSAEWLGLVAARSALLAAVGQPPAVRRAVVARLRRGHRVVAMRLLVVVRAGRLHRGVIAIARRGEGPIRRLHGELHTV